MLRIVDELDEVDDLDGPVSTNDEYLIRPLEPPPPPGDIRIATEPQAPSSAPSICAATLVSAVALYTPDPAQASDVIITAFTAPSVNHSKN